MGMKILYSSITKPSQLIWDKVYIFCAFVGCTSLKLHGYARSENFYKLGNI